MAGRSGNDRKCPKKNTTVCLNDLPDEILLHILCFLPTKSLVATSLLSRRWQYLWTSTPNLQLHESSFLDQRDEFMNFVERALVFRERTPLISFSLSCTVRNDACRINTWIASAIRSNVEQLDLYLLRFPSSFVLPSCIFGCQTLVKLVLRMIIIIEVPSVICLPRLKHLTLKWLEFADNESAEKLLSHPMLEELILGHCGWCFVKTVNVNSPKLQSLSIDDRSDDHWSRSNDHWSIHHWSEERQLCFLGDNLKLFSYKGDLPPTQYCICGSTAQLREAQLLVKIPNHKVLDIGVASKRYLKLVNSLSRVQKLTLLDETAESLYLLSQRPELQTTIPVFERVTLLNLSAYYPRTIRIDSAWLKMIFKRCPQLEHLNFMKVVVFDSLTENLRLLWPMHLCFHTHLKKITLRRYDPKCDKLVNSIHVLLNSAPVLEEMVILWRRDPCTSDQVSMAEELERELNAHPKVSENCRVSIVLV